MSSTANTATFTVTNTGTRPGTEISQAYIQLPPSSGEHFRRLAGFTRTALAAGETRTVTVDLEPLALKTWNEPEAKWDELPGTYTLSVGGSSTDLPLHLQTTR